MVIGIFPDLIVVAGWRGTHGYACGEGAMLPQQAPGRQERHAAAVWRDRWPAAATPSRG
jgi:hypothetical protein